MSNNQVNKTSVVAQIKHIPTGLVIRCQETRSLQQNRKIARLKLQRQLDDLENGEQSRAALKKELAQKRARSVQKKKNRKYAMRSGQENSGEEQST